MMTDTFWTTFFIALPATIAAVATLIVSTKNNKLSRQIEVATNSMKDALMVSTEKEALARGVKEGMAQEQDRQGVPGKAELLDATRVADAAKQEKNGIIRDETIKQQD